MIQYKGYIAQVEYNVPAGRFMGRVVNARDAITFGAHDRRELLQALQDSIEAYLAFCPERDEPIATLQAS